MATLKLKVLPKFPSQVLGGTGITVTKSGGIYTIASTAVIGPASSTDRSIATFSGITGNQLLSSSATISAAGLISTTSVKLQGDADLDPTLTPASEPALVINGTANGASLVAGISATTPFPAWIQARNWLGSSAIHLFLNSAGGGVAINTSISTLAAGLVNGVQIGDNWPNAASYTPPGGTNAVNALNVYGPSGSGNQGISSYTRTLNASGSAQAISGYAFADNAADRGAWPFYGEGHRLTANDYAYGMELAVVNRFNNVIEINPFNSPATGGTVGFQIDAGNGVAAATHVQYTASAGILFVNNAGAGQTNQRGFAHGIIFRSDALDSTLFSPPDAIALAGNTSQHAISWWRDGSNRAWKLYSDAASGSNSINLAAGGIEATGYLISTVASGNVFHKVLSGTVDMRMQANSASSAAALGTISNHPWQLTVNNAEVGRYTTVGLTLGVAGTLAGSLKLSGVTSGTIELKAAATAGTNVITFPAGTTDFSATGGASQVVKQTSSGGAFTVAQLSNADISGLGTAATKNTGTSGNTVPLLDGANTWSGVNTYSTNTHYSVVGGTGAGFWLSGVTTGADRFFFGSDASLADVFRIYSALTGANTYTCDANGSVAHTFTGRIDTNLSVKTGATTVASLPTCNAGAKGTRFFVTDSNAASYTAGIGAIVAGGGATNVPVVCDGTNWRIG